MIWTMDVSVMGPVKEFIVVGLVPYVG